MCVSDATDYRLHLGLVIETVRDYRGLTQEQLAAEVGTQGSTIGRWERGENEPGVEVIARIARVLDFPAEWIVDPPPARTRVLVQVAAYDEARGRPAGPPPAPSPP